METIEFVTKDGISAAQQFYEFFELNPQYELKDYEPITTGIRAYYVILAQDAKM